MKHVNVFQLQAKREAIAQGYAFWIQSVTGKRPQIDRSANGRNITLTQAQTKAMSNSIYESMTSKASPDDLNVSMPWGAILMPAVTKVYWPYALGLTVFIAGLGYVLGSGGGRKKRKIRR